MLLLKEMDMITPSEMTEHFDFRMPGVSISLHILKEADLVTEGKGEKNRLYSLNRKTTTEQVRFFDDMYAHKLKLLKEYVENKEMKKQNLIR